MNHGVPDPPMERSMDSSDASCASATIIHADDVLMPPAPETAPKINPRSNVANLDAVREHLLVLLLLLPKVQRGVFKGITDGRSRRCWKCQILKLKQSHDLPQSLQCSVCPTVPYVSSPLKECTLLQQDSSNGTFKYQQLAAKITLSKTLSRLMQDLLREVTENKNCIRNNWRSMKSNM